MKRGNNMKKDENNITFEDLKQDLLYHSIKEWHDNEIVLDNDIKIKIEETDSDCCAHAEGKFEDVVLDAVITSVEDITYKIKDDDDTRIRTAECKIFHNQNLICKATGYADGGNGGYYYSIASFIVEKDGNEYVAHFVDDTSK